MQAPSNDSKRAQYKDMKCRAPAEAILPRSVPKYVAGGRVAAFARARTAARIIGVASGLGARDPGCGDGPEALSRLRSKIRLPRNLRDAQWHELRPTILADEPLAMLERLLQRLCRGTRRDRGPS